MANGQVSGEKLFKFILLGDGAAGKTSLATRFAHDQFDKQYKPTVGVDFFLKRIMLPGGINVTVQLWDVGGQALSGQMLDKYLYGASAILFVYDITNLASIENLQDWLTAIREVFVESEATPYLALVANKSDLEYMRIVKSERHVKFSQDNGMSAHCVCAKTGESVNLCFQKIAGELLGIRLTRSEQENVQPVVKAEIIHAPPQSEAKQATPSTNSAKTAVCIVQ